MNNQELATVLSRAGAQNVPTFAPLLAEAFALPDIDECLVGSPWPTVDILRFLANAMNETGGFTALTENLNYTTAAVLLRTFPSAFAHHDPNPYLRNPQALANLVYDSRLGFSNSRFLGNVQDGDGWRYRGRGLFQTTGRAGYAAFAKASGVDVVSNPDLLGTPSGAVSSAVKFWEGNALNEKASLADVRRVIGGSLFGLPQVQAYYDKLAAACAAVGVTL